MEQKILIYFIRQYSSNPKIRQSTKKKGRKQERRKESTPTHTKPSST
jgi:hypothetical protein